MTAKPIKHLISATIALAMVVGVATVASATQLYIRIVADNNRTIVLDAQPSDTVAVIKQKISDVEAISTSRQILTFAGQTLDDTLTLSDYNIQQQATILLTVTALPCEAGTSSSTGNQPCAPAPIGRFVSTVGATTADPCEAGTYQDQVGQIACIAAAVGYYVENTGAYAQTVCPAGYTSTARAIACTLIPAVRCTPGNYSATGNAPCTAAVPGFFVDMAGATGQLQCPSGTSSTAQAIACVANVVMPIAAPPILPKSLLIGGYSVSGTILTAAMKNKTKAFVFANPGLTKISCVGDITGVSKNKSQLALSKSRAKAACAYARTLNKSLTTSYLGKQSLTKGKITRTVSLTLIP